MKGKILVLGIFAILAVMLSVVTVNAAVTGCLNASEVHKADDTGGWPLYNNTGTVTNVSVGNVCINITHFNVAPTASAYCGATWSNLTDGECYYYNFYVGYNPTVDLVTPTCNVSNWTSGTRYTIAQGYMINTTFTGNYSTVLPFQSSAGRTGPNATGCHAIGRWNITASSGYCDGGNAVAVNDTSLHVAVGKVCINSTAVNQTVTSVYNCGSWLSCIENNQSAGMYYVGYAATGTACSSTGWVTASSLYNTSTGQYISLTTNATSCTVKGYAYSYTSGDFQNIVVDALGYAGAETVSWVDLIVLLLVVGFIIGLIIKGVGLFR